MPSTRRRPTRDYAEVRRFAAHREAGRRYWRWYVFGPHIGRVVVLVAAVAGLAALWLAVPHLVLGVAAVGLSLALAVGWMIYTGSDRQLQQRMSARATGRAERGAGLGWAVAGVVILLGVTGWLSLGSPWA